MRRAVFFDKDGVINFDKGISGNSEPIEFIDGIGSLIAGFRALEFGIFVVTNQPVVARGLMSEPELEKYLRGFEALLLENDAGAVIDRIYYCPHHPNANVEKYRTGCDCRKPRPGMLFRAATEFGIDLSASFMVGDRMSDVIAGALAGCRTIQFLSGKHNEKAIESDLKLEREIFPDYKITDLTEMRGIIR